MNGIQRIICGLLLCSTCIRSQDDDEGAGESGESEFRYNYKLTKRFFNTPNNYGMETKCPSDQFMIAFRVQYTKDKIGGFFYKCALSSNFEKLSDEQGYASSGVRNGKFTDEYSANGLILGFDFATKESGKDGYTLTNIKAYTSDPENPEVKTETGIKDGKYSTVPLLCLKRKAVCGMSLQDKTDGKGDITLLEFKCCPIPDTARNCEGKDSWRTLKSCDHRDQTDPKAGNLGCTRKVTTGVSKSDTSHTSGLESGMQSLTFGFSAGFEAAGVSATMEASVGVSKATGMSWTKEDTQLFSETSTITVSTDVAPLYQSFVQQAVGTCGPFTLRSNVYRRVDRKAGSTTTTPRKPKEKPKRRFWVSSTENSATETITYMRIDRVDNKTVIRQDVGCFTY